jgi:ClpP class serine protease
VSKATIDTVKHGNGRSQLVVWGLVNMHKGTSEWSVQGLSSTAAALVEAGQRMGRKVVLVEEAESDLSREDEGAEGEHAGGEDAEDQGDIEEINGLNDNGELEDDRPVVQEIKRQSGIYHKRLPMLNGSSKTDANDLEAGAWSGRTVEVGIVLKRWFRFTGEKMLP